MTTTRHRTAAASALLSIFFFAGLVLPSAPRAVAAARCPAVEAIAVPGTTQTNPDANPHTDAYSDPDAHSHPDADPGSD